MDKVKISVTAKVINDDRLGRLVKGDVREMPAHKAQFFLRRGEVELYETKVVRERPLEGAGTQQSASPVAQVLQAQTLSASESGEKKRRGRPSLSQIRASD